MENSPKHRGQNLHSYALTAGYELMEAKRMWCVPQMRILVLVLLLFLATQATAELKLPAAFGDGMVLQRERPVLVWGSADPKAGISVACGASSGETTADDKGHWQVELAALDAGGPFELKIRAGKEEVVFKDVLVGEVWLCAGQSNMAFVIKGRWKIANAEEEIRNADFPRLRLFNAPYLYQKPLLRVPAREEPRAWKPCTPQIAADLPAVPYFFGRKLLKELDLPIGIVSASKNGVPIETFCPLKGIAFQYQYQIRPFAPYAMRGVIWYQGESNVADGYAYRAKFERLVATWRKLWKHDDLPFYYVQIAPYRYEKDVKPDDQKLPWLWEAQRTALALPCTGMAVVSDVATVDNIHPPDKQTVGDRLALQALANTYGRKDLVCSGPLYKACAAEGASMRVQFGHAGGGLATRDGKPPDGFEVAGEDGVFVPAQARIEGDSVMVTSAAVTKPKLVRLGWDQCARPNLMNKEGLPAASFTSQPPPQGAGEAPRK